MFISVSFPQLISAVDEHGEKTVSQLRSEVGSGKKAQRGLLRALRSGDGTGPSQLSDAPAGSVESLLGAESRGHCQPCGQSQRRDRQDGGGCRRVASIWDALVLLKDFQTMGFGPEAVRLGQPTGSVPSGKAAPHHARAPEEQMQRGSGKARAGAGSGPHFRAWGAGSEPEDALGSRARVFPEAAQQLQSGFSFSGEKKKIDFFMTHRIELDHVSTPNLQRIYPRVFEMSPLILKFLFRLRG